jgi:hypothetical protein
MKLVFVFPSLVFYHLNHRISAQIAALQVTCESGTCALAPSSRLVPLVCLVGLAGC